MATPGTGELLAASDAVEAARLAATARASIRVSGQSLSAVVSYALMEVESQVCGP
jgi:hypothetical protein